MTSRPASTSLRAATRPAIPAPTPITCAMTRLASAALVDELDDAGQHVGIGVGGHAVAEVDDVRRRRVPTLEHVTDVRLERRPRGGEQRGIDVALQRNTVSGLLDEEPVRLVEGRAPVDSYRVRDAGHQVEDAGAAESEVD